jgi:hypothetical protein
MTVRWNGATGRKKRVTVMVGVAVCRKAREITENLVVGIKK